MNFDDAPAWLKAADAHNVAGEGSSIFEDVAAAIGNAPNFLQVSIASGLNSFYNTGVAIGNLFRSDDDQIAFRDTKDWISEYDEDLGKYYERNKTAADVAGFIAGSFVPGLGATKLLTLGQKALTAATAAGEIGSNLSLATKLLVPSTELYVKKAGAELAAKSATFTFANQSSLRALASGVHQGVLEALAFETAVTATMFQSPLLSEMDTWDLVKNAAFGIALGGGIGGIIGGAQTYSGVSKLLKNADERQKLATWASPRAAGTSLSDNIVLAIEDRSALLREITPEEVRALKTLQGETGVSLTEEVLTQEAARLNQLRQANVQKFDNEIRTSFRELTGDDDIANQFLDIAKGLTSDEQFGVFLNLKEAGKLSKKFEVEKLERQIRAKLKDQGLTGKALETAVAKELINNQGMVYQLHSGGIGKQYSEFNPRLATLADKYSKEQIDNLVIKHSGRAKNKQFDFRELRDAEEMEIRWIWARKYSAPLNPKQVVGAYDLPLLDKAVRDGMTRLQIIEDGTKRTLESADEIKTHLINAKQEVWAHQLDYLNSSIGKSPVTELGTRYLEIATDIRKDFIEGAFNGSADDALFAQRSYAKELSDFLRANGTLRPESQGLTELDLHYRPKYLKANYNTTVYTDDAGMELEGMALIKYRQKIQQQAVDNVFAEYAGQRTALFPEIPESLLRKAWRGGTGAGVFTQAGGAYDSLERMISYIGMQVAELKKEKIQLAIESITPVATKLAAKPEEAIKWSVLNEQLLNTPERYVLNETGDALIPRKIRDYQLALQEAEATGVSADSIKPPVLHPGTVEEFRLDSPELRDMVTAHINLTAKRNEGFRNIAAVEGLENQKYPDTFYPVKPDVANHKYVAFVKDDSLVGVGHTRMLLATTAQDLEAQIAKVRQTSPQYRIITKDQAEEWYRARGEFDYDKTLHENYLDVDLPSRGIYSRFLPKTDPQEIINEFVAHHTRGENALINEMVGVKYAPAIQELRRLGEQYANIPGSRTGSMYDLAVSKVKNPYTDQIKNLLNISKTEQLGWFGTIQQKLDDVVSRAWRSAEQIWDRKGLTDDAKIELINETFDKVGFKSAYYDAALNLMANAPVPKGVLTKFVRTANAFLTTTILRLDPFNALNNLLGNTVLFSSELNLVTNGIAKGSKEAVGELSKLYSIKLPGTEAEFIRSPSKLIAKSFERLHGPQAKQLIEEYKRRGLAPDLTDQYYKSLDALTISGAETTTELNVKSSVLRESMTKLAQTGERLTGNRWAEQFNRLIAADVMKQITDVAVKHGLMDSGMAWNYINTFVSRVNGVVRASERPLMFQGPIGQAMGLFQSYQFNLMANAFRLIGEGRGKQMAMLLGLQSSIYGASSLPGFNLINNAIGNASGNSEHHDLFSATQALFGQTGSDWLMFGAPSNVLRASLYTRGDTNPRVWSIVPNPTNPGDIPFISSFARAIESIKDTAGKISNGAPVLASMMTGLEHLGLSRPLAGLAQAGRAIVTGQDVQTTSRQGGIMGSNDLVSWATLVRVAGAKPLDDAIVTNAFFRIKGYQQADLAKRDRLGDALKESIRSGNEITPEMVEEFAANYARLGGKQTGFNSWMMNQLKNASTTQAAQLANRLDSPYARRMQEVMGGRYVLEEVPGMYDGAQN